MSVQPGHAVPCQRASVAVSTLALCGLLVFTACDQPIAPEVAGSAPLAIMEGSSIQCPALPGGSGNAKTAAVNVKLSTNEAVGGVVVTLIHPVQGPVCSATTDNSGTASFTNLTQGAEFLLSIRDEVSPYAPLLEIGPPAPNPFALDVLRDGPSRPLFRQTPTLLSGGLACATTSALTWSGYDAAYDTPCIVPSTGPPTFAVNVQLAGTDSMVINIVDPNGTVSGPVLVAAISTPRADAMSPCTKMPWSPLCADEMQFSGPGLLQAMSVTETGRIALGVAPGSDPLYIEVTAPQSGFEDAFTLFGTLVISPEIQASSAHGHTVFLAPGMCTITTVVDASEPSGFSELDIQRSGHGVGLRAIADELEGWDLDAVPATIVVQAVIHATAIGGTGEFNMQYRGVTGPGNLAVRIPFSIEGNICSVGAATGSGTGSGVVAVGFCSETHGATAYSTTEYTLYFTVAGLPELAGAEYRINAAKDHLDPSRADGSAKRNLSRGAINITDLDPPSCPVPGNNDGRWTIV